MSEELSDEQKDLLEQHRLDAEFVLAAYTLLGMRACGFPSASIEAHLENQMGARDTVIDKANTMITWSLQVAMRDGGVEDDTVQH